MCKLHMYVAHLIQISVEIVKNLLRLDTKMKWQDVIAKHWKGIEEAAEKALISIERELRECYLSQQFDDDLKQYLLCRTQNGYETVEVSFLLRFIFKQICFNSI